MLQRIRHYQFQFGSKSGRNAFARRSRGPSPTVDCGSTATSASKYEITFIACACRHRGRTTNCPTAPALIPACSFPAPGSSERLASAKGVAAFVAIPLSEVGMGCPAFSCPDQVSFVGCVLLSAPSPCERLSRSLSTRSGSDFLQTVGSLPFGSGSPTCRPLPWPSCVKAPAYVCLRVSPSVAQYPSALQPSSGSLPRNQESEGSPKFLTLPFTHTTL
jgi:hypothetical protein